MSAEEARRLAPRFAARAAGHDREGVFPAADFADLRRSGMFGLMVPERLGGAGAGFADYAAVAYELARGNGSTALIFNMHASVTGALGGVIRIVTTAPDLDRVSGNVASEATEINNGALGGALDGTVNVPIVSRVSRVWR